MPAQRIRVWVLVREDGEMAERCFCDTREQARKAAAEYEMYEGNHYLVRRAWLEVEP